jgi:Ca2+-binding RTX toxin-like protein
MSKYLRPRSVAISALVVAVASILVGSALAVNVVGTAKNDTLRGTAKADRLVGQAGDDKLYGLGGKDVLKGGPGNDLVVGGPGADALSCGSGQDMARGDAQDKVAKDCEIVRGVPAPEPPAPPPLPPPPAPPPAAPVTPGSYQGLLDGNYIFFDVRPDRTIANFRSNYIQENCDQGGYVYGTVNWGPTAYPISADGSFSFSARGEGTIDDAPATFIDEVTGRFDGTAVTGTYTGSSEFDYDGTHFKCTSGARTWTASLVP